MSWGPLAIKLVTVLYGHASDCTYDEWISVGKALHETDPGETGLELWDAWSASDSRYNKDVIEARWNSFK